MFLKCRHTDIIDFVVLTIFSGMSKLVQQLIYLMKTENKIQCVISLIALTKHT